MTGWVYGAMSPDHSIARTSSRSFGSTLSYPANIVVPGSFDADFSPPPADVQKRLDVDLPDELVVWITTTAEQELRLADGDLLSVWPWFLIRAAPVALPPKVIGFADLRTGRDGDDRYAIAIDLRSQPGAGQVVRAKVQSGDLPKWPASQPEVIATDSAAWLVDVPTYVVNG